MKIKEIIDGKIPRCWMSESLKILASGKMRGAVGRGAKLTEPDPATPDMPET